MSISNSWCMVGKQDQLCNMNTQENEGWFLLSILRFSGWPSVSRQTYSVHHIEMSMNKYRRSRDKEKPLPTSRISPITKLYTLKYFLRHMILGHNYKVSRNYSNIDFYIPNNQKNSMLILAYIDKSCLWSNMGVSGPFVFLTFLVIMIAETRSTPQ